MNRILSVRSFKWNWNIARSKVRRPCPRRSTIEKKKLIWFLVIFPFENASETRYYPFLWERLCMGTLFPLELGLIIIIIIIAKNNHFQSKWIYRVREKKDKHFTKEKKANLFFVVLSKCDNSFYSGTIISRQIALH